jgi:hypothetical protein
MSMAIKLKCFTFVTAFYTKDWNKKIQFRCLSGNTAILPPDTLIKTKYVPAHALTHLGEWR